MTRPRKLDDADKAKILDRVRKGDYLTKIARETGFNTSIIRATAQRAGLVIQRCSEQQMTANMLKGQRKGREKAEVVRLAPVMSMEQYWKGMKASLRW